MRNAFKFAVLAVMLFLVQFSFADTIPTDGMRRIIIVPLTQTVLQLHQSKETSFP